MTCCHGSLYLVQKKQLRSHIVPSLLSPFREIVCLFVSLFVASVYKPAAVRVGGGVAVDWQSVIFKRGRVHSSFVLLKPAERSSSGQHHLLGNTGE